MSFERRNNTERFEYDRKEQIKQGMVRARERVEQQRRRNTLRDAVSFLTKDELREVAYFLVDEREEKEIAAFIEGGQATSSFVDTVIRVAKNNPRIAELIEEGDKRKKKVLQEKEFEKRIAEGSKRDFEQQKEKHEKDYTLSGPVGTGRNGRVFPEPGADGYAGDDDWED